MENAEALALLQQFHAGCHRRLVLLLEQLVIGGLGLLVAAGQVGELLLANRLLVQPPLIGINLGFQRRRWSVRGS